MFAWTWPHCRWPSCPATLEQGMGVIVMLLVTGNPAPSSSGRWWGSPRLLFMVSQFESVCVWGGGGGVKITCTNQGYVHGSF